MARYGWILIASLVCSPSFAWSQETKPAGTGMAMFRQAYELTKAARTDADLTKVIDLCQQGFATGVSEPEEKYGKNLIAWTFNRRGETRANAGQENEALADFESAIQFDAARYAAYHNRGVSLGMAGRYEEALADFNQVLKLKPDHAKAHFNRGEIRFRQGDLNGAMEDYNLCLRLVPNDSAALNSRGFVYYSQGNYRAAMQNYSQAIQSDNNNAEAHTNRGDAQADLGQFAAALRDFQAAVRANPQYGRAYQSVAWLRATAPDPQVFNADLALKSAQKAIELDGDQDYRYLDALAAAHAANGQFEEAKEAIAKALALAEEAQAPPATVQRMQARQKLYEQGKAFREAAAAAPQPPSNQPPINRPPTNRRR